MKTLDVRAVDLALKHVQPADFEKFAQAFYAAIQGSQFVPVGGQHDGGAEGFDVEGLYSDARPGRFMQASIAIETRAKIRHTIRRIKEFGREISSLVYLTSAVVPRPDQEEEMLSDEFGIQVRIRDAKYLAVHINDSVQTVQAFTSYLSHYLDYLRKVGSAETIGEVPRIPSRSLCVFLGQELERRSGNTEMLEGVTDSLILWSLEGTDPDQGRFMSKEDMLSKIEQALPTATKFIRGVIDTRLERLTAKDNTDGRQIRAYPKKNQYCLPYETRQIVEVENAEDEYLRSSVSGVFRARMEALLKPEDEPGLVTQAIDACHRALEFAYRTQGLEMAYFVGGDEPENFAPPSISDHLSSAITDLGLHGATSVRIAELAYDCLRHTIYDSSEEERRYLGKLSRTYILMFLLRNDAKIVEYFKSMSADLFLYIGTDILIRCLSEYYLPKKDQSTINTLEILKAAGSKLLITERCVEEVWTHLEAADYEYLNNYVGIEPYVGMELARNIDRILIRAFFYSRLNPRDGVAKPSGWKSYIGNFCEYRSLHTQKGREEIREYLIKRFGLTFEPEDVTLKSIDTEELDNLTISILSERKRNKNVREKEERLAENDAVHVLRVFSRRMEGGERSLSNPFGFKTWWLTQDSAVRRASGAYVFKNKGRFMMRPEFLLHFIGLSPSAEKVRQSYETIFPTLLGVRLSSRLREDIFKSTLSEIKAAFEVDEARAQVKLADLSNQLKGDFFKQYA